MSGCNLTTNLVLRYDDGTHDSIWNLLVLLCSQIISIYEYLPNVAAYTIFNWVAYIRILMP